MFFQSSFSLSVMDIGQRVKKAIEESGVSPEDVRASCKLKSIQAVYAWMRGDVKNLRNDNLFALADLTGFEARWLGTGKGQEKQPSNPREASLLEKYRAADARGQDMIQRVAESQSSYAVEGLHEQKRSA